MHRFFTALGHACNGICYGVRTQRNMRLHLIAAVLVMSLGFWKGLDAVRWMLLVLLIAVVIAAELINTAIEAVVDLASPEQHPLAKAAKDTAAGSVLVLAFAAVVIAAFLFLF